MKEYFDMGHAERVPAADLSKPHHDTFYFPMHIVRKESSSTTKLRAVFDASAKSSTGVSLNDTLQVGPTVHSTLIDVLLRFRSHRVALTSDVSRMYRAVKLVPSDRDFHRFIWRSSPGEQLSDYRMTRVTFGVSASSFAANMSVKQNAIDFGAEYPLAAKAVNDSFYVDDCISGADTVDEAIALQQQLQELFSKAGFLLRKWRSSELTVLEHIPPDLRDSQSMQQIPNPGEYTKTLGIEWNSSKDHFRLTIAKLPPIEHVSKRFLVSDVAKTFDILGWFSPAMIKVKILLQQLWELKVGWDDTVPPQIHDDWLQWRAELDLLSRKLIPRYYFSKSIDVASIQLHGFCDASEKAYAGVIYLRMTGSDGSVEVSLVCSKTKVAPIKRLTIPHLELCGAHLLSQLLHHVQGVLRIPSTNIFAWTDSTIVLNWIVGNPRRFKTYVGNRVSSIVENIPPERWNHINGTDNPADCASRGLFPSELLEHHLWWSGPEWLRYTPTYWPEQSNIPPNEISEEKNEICLHTTIAPRTSIIQIERFSSFDRLIRVTAWSMRFLHNCRTRKRNQLNTINVSPVLTMDELNAAEIYLLSTAQQECFSDEIHSIKQRVAISKSSSILPLHPFMDSSGLLRVGGRDQNSKLPYATQHPVILHSKHVLTKVVIQSEHLRLLHAGPTLLTASLGRRFHIVAGTKAIRSLTRGCTVCRHNAAKSQPQVLGQLPKERVTPDIVFDKVGVDYAGPVFIKHGYVRKPIVVKAYICVFVSLSVKAVHLELVSDLTSDAFIACLRRFISRRGKPSLIWSDHGTNFVGANRELQELVEFLELQKTNADVSQFC